nr:sulfatase-like hydrolase/transferase [Brucella intermedia]
MKPALNIVAATAFLLFTMNYVSYLVTGREFDESSIYQIVYGFEATNLYAFVYIILAIVASLCILILILFGFHRFPIIRRLRNIELTAIVVGLAVYISLNAVATKVAHAVSVSMGFKTNPAATDFGQRFKAVPVNASLKKNVVFVYLESFERTFLDETLFPGLTPNIARIEQQADHFTEIAGLVSAGWTMGGMVASQCGLPLVTPLGSSNSMGRVGSFLSGANCLGDIMRSHGYRLEFFGGAPKQFAGKDKFYTTHGFHSVKGLEELRKDGETVSEWGRHDDNTFRDLIGRYQELLSSSQPFGLFALTLDTHSPNGYLSGSCGDTVYGDGSNAMLNAVHCNDKIVGEFIDTIMAVPGSENTLFVFASDHLAMRNTASQILESGKRRNLFMVFDGQKAAGNSFDKPGTTLDIGATVMDYMTDGDIKKMGLGRSLRNPKAKTLIVREENAETVDKKLATWRENLLLFWQFARSVEGGIEIRAHQEVAIENVVLAYPVLLELDGKTVNEIALDETIDKLSSLVSTGKQSLLIDSCNAIALHLGRASVASGACYIYNGEGGKLVWGRLEEAHRYGIDQLQIGGDAVSDQEKYRFYMVAQTGAYPENFYVSDNFDTDADTDLKIISSGFETGSVSTVRRGDQKLMYELIRGLNFVAIDDDGKVSVVGNIDVCTGNIGNLKALQSQVQQAGPKVLIVASDTAHCGATDKLHEVFGAFGLQKWKEVGFRAPYIATIQHGIIREYVGRQGAKLSVWNSVPDILEPHG